MSITASYCVRNVTAGSINGSMKTTRRRKMARTFVVGDLPEPQKKGKKSKEWEHFTPSFVGTQVQLLDVAELEKQMKQSQKLYEASRLGQTEGKAIIKTDSPISIFFIGDVHYGSVYTDHERFVQEIDVIRNTPGAYICWMANLIDNGIPSQFPSNMLSNVTTPDKQVIAMRKLLQDLNARGKVLGAVTSPCHEGWTYKHTGQDINALMFGFEGRKFPVLDNGGRLYLKVGKTTYCVVLYHQVGSFESNFNETHALRQMNRLNLCMEGDVVVGAHRHFAAAQMVYEGVGEHIKPVAYIRSGTYKGVSRIHDQWSIGQWGTTGEPSAQSVILYPNQRRMVVNLEFGSGVEVYNAVLNY
jgi:hypothetical protein